MVASKIINSRIPLYVLCAFGIFLVISSCASQPKRGITNDVTHRICIDPRDLDASTHMKLQAALLADGRFQIVDRGKAMEFAKQEQEDENKESHFRYGAKETYSEWAKNFGCGSIVAAQADCQMHENWTHYQFFVCSETLTAIDASTGEVIAAGQATAETSDGIPSPGWADAVVRLGDSFPKRFIDVRDPHLTVQYDESMKKYRDKIEQNGIDRADGRTPASLPEQDK